MGILDQDLLMTCEWINIIRSKLRPIVLRMRDELDFHDNDAGPGRLETGIGIW